jgi:Ca2+-binding RTX toxin-like protein
MCIFCSQAGIGSGGPACTDLPQVTDPPDDKINTVLDSAAVIVNAGVSAAPVFSLAQIIQQLRTQWGGAYEGTTESWSGSGPINYYIGGPPYSTAEEGAFKVNMTALMVSRAVLAFELWDDLIARDLNPTSTAAFGQIQFEYASQTYNGPVLATNGGTYSRSWFNANGTNGYGTANYATARDEIWLNSNWTSHDQDSDMYFGGYGFETYMHEIGHSLGLSHPGTYNAGSGGTITYASNAEYAQDNRQYTIMSYFGGYLPGSGWQQDGTLSNYLYSSTPMRDDVAAIQAIYGADMTTRPGDTTYGFHVSTGVPDVFNFAIDTSPIVTVWDAGGNDTLDLSGYTSNQRIDLHAGAYSDVGGMLSNFAIAYNVTIENAIGGSGNDTIIGNDANNWLFGAAGNDTIDGGAGTDSARFSGVRALYTITALGGSTVRVVGPDGTDIVSNVEQLIFDDQVFTVNVGGGPMALNGTGGPDDLVGGPAGDVLNGFGGNDKLTGKGGADRLAGGAGADIFVFDASSLSDAQGGIFDRITDYDQGNAPKFVASEGDQINLAAVLGTAFSGGQPAGLLVRAIREGIDGASLLQVDSDGSANGTHWTTIARLDGVAAGETLNVILSDSQPAGTTIVVQDMNSTTKVGNYDGDSHGDLLWRNTDGTVGIWLMDGPNIVAPRNVAVISDDWHVAGIGDFGGDGKGDILWRNDSGLVGMWQLNGNAIAGAGDILQVSSDWHVVGTGDFGGDGKSDILWRNDAGLVGVWQMNGTAIVSAANILQIDNSWHVAGTGDFNGDGKSDILWRNDNGVIGIWHMNGTAIASAENIPQIDPAWHIAGTGDFNGDGRSDILWRNDSGLVGMWQMNGSAVQAATDILSVSLDWHIIGTGDFNGDGKADILWNSDDGTIGLWTMNGGAIQSATNIHTAPHDWTTVAHHWDLV